MDNDYNFDFRDVRKSVFDMQAMTLDNAYEGELPEELEKFHYYFVNDGHCLMVIPRNYLKQALEENCLDDYEIQIPVKFVLEKGYSFVDNNSNYIVGNFDYDDENEKVMVPLDYYEM